LPTVSLGPHFFFATKDVLSGYVDLTILIDSVFKWPQSYNFKVPDKKL